MDDETVHLNTNKPVSANEKCVSAPYKQIEISLDNAPENNSGIQKSDTQHLNNLSIIEEHIPMNKNNFSTEVNNINTEDTHNCSLTDEVNIASTHNDSENIESLNLETQTGRKANNITKVTIVDKQIRKSDRIKLNNKNKDFYYKDDSEYDSANFSTDHLLHKYISYKKINKKKKKII